MSAIAQYIKNHQASTAILLAITYQVCCCIQGFDLSDEGWAMYFFQQIYKNPECVEAQMPYWLTGIIGGTWNWIFPHGGFILTRLIGVAMITATFYMVYHCLKHLISSGWLLIGLLAQTVIVAGDPKPFGYNSLTAFFTLIVIFLFLRGLQHNKTIFLFLGGMLLGMNIFVRIPNIAILPILLLIPFYFYTQGRQMRLCWQPLSTATLGILVGIAVVVLAMIQTGHWDLFLNAMGGVADSANNAENSHQFGKLIIRYLKNYWGILSVGIIITCIGIVYNLLLKNIQNKVYHFFANAIVMGILIFLSFYYHKALRHNEMYFVNFIAYTGCLLILITKFKNKNQSELNYIAMAGLLMCICLPLGSDQGINTMWTSTWLALPLSMSYLHQILCKKDYHIQLWEHPITFKRRNMQGYIITLTITYFICGIYKVDNLAYYDPGSRFQKTYAIDNIYCKGIYTNAYRAGLMNELLPELSKYVKPNDYLLVYNFMPGLNYMTDTKSYISNAWLWCLSGAELEKQLTQSQHEKKILPVVVRQHFVATNEWQEYDPDFDKLDNNGIINPLSTPSQTKAINQFLEKNRYYTIRTNKNFEILLPEKPD